MDEVTVDRKTLKALGADTRINILKNLARKRMTQAELADALGISAPSVKEHMDQLVNVDLIEVNDTGRKWKYYSVTQKGKTIVEPSNVKVWFLLSISLLALVASFSQLYGVFSNQIPEELLIREVTTIQPQLNSPPLAAVQENQPETFVQATSAPSTTAPELSVQEAAVQTDVQTAEQNVEPQVSERREVTGYKSLFNSLPVNETAVFLVSLLLLGLSLGFLLKRD